MWSTTRVSLSSVRVISCLLPQLVNYTANLTEERDELNANLEEAKKALQRELATRIALESKGQMSQGRKVKRCCWVRSRALLLGLD